MHRTRTWNMDQPVLRGRNRVLPMEGGDGSTLSLDFTAMSGLDSRFTFSRSSTATFINSSGLVQYADANLILQSESLATSPWIPTNGASVADVSATNPIGGSTATQLTAGGANNSVLQAPSLAANVPHTVRFWVRGGTSTQMQFGYFSGSFQTASNITVVGSGSVTGTGLMLITGLSATTWTQVTFVLASPATAGGSLLFYPDTASPTVGRTNFVWGVQINPGSTASAYNRTTTSAYHAPRFDYDPTTLAPRGLLVEGSAINLTRYSEELNQVSGFSYWFGTNFNTPSKSGSPTDPFNGTNAWKLIASSGSGFHGWRQIYTFTAAAYTFSFWAKAAEYDRVILSDLTSGQGGCAFVLSGSGTATVIAGTVTPTNPTIVPHQNGWYRCSVTIVMPATSPGIAIAGYPIGATTSAFGTSYTADGTSGVWITGVQTELGSGASSYIPTGASTVQRAADDLQLTGSNFSSIWPSGLSEWSVYWSGDITRAPATTQLVWLARAGGSSRTRGVVTTGSSIRSSNNIADLTPGLNATVNTVFKMATGFKNADCFMWAHNGTTTASASDTSSGLQTDSDRLLFNVNADNFMHIRQFKFWQSRLSNGTLQGLVS